MSTEDEQIGQFADDIRRKCGQEPDMDLVRKMAEALEPAIFGQDSKWVAATDPGERETVKREFLIGRLGLEDGPELDAAIERAVSTYGEEAQKYRLVLYYLLTKDFGKDEVFK